MELSELHDKFISEGYNNFYIEGVGGLQPDDVHCLGFNNQYWNIYYIERGQKSEPIFISKNKDEAIEFYINFVSNIEHWHIVAFTRFEEKLNFIKEKIEKLNLRTIQNDIPALSYKNDRVFRLFVVNKDIFLVKENIKEVPYFDKELKKYCT